VTIDYGLALLVLVIAVLIAAGVGLFIALREDRRREYRAYLTRKRRTHRDDDDWRRDA
jgi:hypothetical protein